MPRSFDRLAGIYEHLERTAFGDHLTKARLFHLETLPKKPRRVLIVGDGDGRFCEALHHKFPDSRIVSIDSSQLMLQRARRRLEASKAIIQNIQLVTADIREHALPDNHFDYVCLNFILDCFLQSEVDELLLRFTSSLTEEGYIGYADFSLPSQGLFKQWLCKTIIWALYRFFRLTTDIRAKRLPIPNWPNNLTLVDRSARLDGLLISELRRKASAPT